MRKFIQKTRTRMERKYHKWRHRHLDGYVFIHINKTGGSSIKKALNLPFEHKTALEKIEEHGRAWWDKRFSFTVVRNPWDKVVSHYHYRVRTGHIDLDKENISFTDWVKRAYGDHDPAYYTKPRMFMPQTQWIADQDGALLVNEVCRFESLQDDFARVAAQIGRRVELPHVNASDRGKYRTYYDEGAREIVARWFKADIDRFGYAF